MGAPRDGSEPVLAVARPDAHVETVRWSFEGDPVHLVAHTGPGVRRVYFSNGPPPVEAPDPSDRGTGAEGEVDVSLLLLLLCE